MIYDTIEPCKKKKGYEGIPDEYHSVSLNDLKGELLSNLKSYKLLRENKVMLVLEDDKKGSKLTIFPSCRLFIHGDLEKEEAKSIIREVGKSVEKIIAS